MEKQTIKDLDLCNSTRCNYCRNDCPIYIHSRLEFNSPRGKKELILETLRGKETIRPAEAGGIIFKCFACRRCVSSCPYEMDTPRILWDSRELFKDSQSIQKYLFYLLYNIRSKLRL